jgi:Tol biopolymer transport system component/serine/threonine protein kinase
MNGLFFAQMPPVRTLSAGDIFGNYRLDRPLGGGGMGVVWQATDLRLGRSVALKFLPDEYTSSGDARDRFRREARTASSLNHPNICVVHDFGEEDGRSFLVMELLEGSTLRELLATRSLRISEILDLGYQIADALDAAHQQGIIHRDIKPANIFVLDRSGSGLTAKLLDFGLAKQEPKLWDSATMTAYRTDSGVAIGTVAYMSPEQALGQPIDPRSDLFSFGMVLYEMTTRTLPFRGATSAALFDAILNKAPASLLALNPEAPAELEHIILRLLEKEPGLRYQSAAELRSDLARMKRDFSLATTSGLHRSGLYGSAATLAKRRDQLPFWSRRPAQALFGVLTLVLLGASLYLASRGRSIPKDLRLEAGSFRSITETQEPEYFPQVSPDGRNIVYATGDMVNLDLFLYDTSTGQKRNLTEDHEGRDTEPSLSPDGMQVAFYSNRDGGGLYLLDLRSKEIRRLNAIGRNPAWSPDGTEIAVATEGILRPEDRVTANSQLWAVRSDTGARRLVYAGDAVQPNWSPNGSRIAFWASRGGQRDIFTIRARPLAGVSPEPVALTNDGHVDWNPVFSPDGRWVYFLSDRAGAMGLWRLRIDPESGEKLSEPEAVRMPVEDLAHISFSGGGREVVFVEYRLLADLYRVRFDPAKEVLLSQPEALTNGTMPYTRPDLSPDGLWLAFNGQAKRDHIYLLGTDGATLRQLTDSDYRDRGPRWSPDGKKLAFFSNRAGSWEIWTYTLEGGLLEQVTRGGMGGSGAVSAGTAAWPVWSPDGKRLAYSIFGFNSFLLDLTRKFSEQSPQALPPLENPEERFAAWHWSPDGRKLAGFTQAEAGRITGIAVLDLATGRFEKLSESGQDPYWLKDSQRLLYVDEGKLYLIRQGGLTRQLVLAPPDGRMVEQRGFALSRDNQWIYYSGSRVQSDVWVGHLD